MEKSQKMDKNAQKNAIAYAFNVLRTKGIVKTQSQFARLLGVSEQTISYALNGRGRSLNETLVRRVADYMTANHNIDILTPVTSIFITGDAIAAPQAPADTSIKTQDDTITRLLDKIDEKDAQINRLLNLLEKEQQKHL